MLNKKILEKYVGKSNAISSSQNVTHTITRERLFKCAKCYGLPLVASKKERTISGGNDEIYNKK